MLSRADSVPSSARHAAVAAHAQVLQLRRAAEQLGRQLGELVVVEDQVRQTRVVIEQRGLVSRDESPLGVDEVERVGVRLSPHGEGTMKYYGTDDSDPEALYSYAIAALGKRFPKLGYLLLSEPRWTGREDDPLTDPGFSQPTTMARMWVWVEVTGASPGC